MRLPPWATLLTVLGIAILCALGIWQLERLQWKTELIAEINAARQADPMTFELTRRNLARLPEGRYLVRGFAEGIYRHDADLLLGPRTHDGKPGYHVITPFETIDNTFLLVNRGWVPLTAREQRDYARPSKPLIITGTARRPEPSGVFVPDNDPDAEIWHQLDLDQIATAKGLENVLPLILYADDPGLTTTYPLAAATKWQPPNNHLSYAVFWFTMAGILAIIYFLRFIRRSKNA